MGGKGQLMDGARRRCRRPAAAAAALLCVLALFGRSSAQVLTPQQTSLLLLKVRDLGPLSRLQHRARAPHFGWS